MVAEELTPRMTIELDAAHTMGFVTERGGANSHAAILARSLGIPAVSGIPGIHDCITCGTEILVDGTSGDVVIRPCEATVKAAHASVRGITRRPKPVPPVPGLRVMANISMGVEVHPLEFVAGQAGQEPDHRGLGRPCGTNEKQRFASLDTPRQLLEPSQRCRHQTQSRIRSGN